jgi:hypothetical protein
VFFDPFHAKLTVTPLVLTAAEFGAYITTETAKWAKVIKTCKHKSGAKRSEAACDPLSGRQAADIVGRHLGRQIKLGSAGMTTLRIVSPFNMDLRRLLRVAPNLEAHLNQPAMLS